MKRIPRTIGFPTPVPTLGRPVVAITESVVAQTEDVLRCTRWQTSTERVAYWAGVKLESIWIVTTTIRPNAVVTRGSFKTTAADNADVVSHLVEAGLSLIGQVHTHPGNFVDHSAGDDRDAFMPSENYISIVVPSYGRRGMWPLNNCGVHRYESKLFRRLSDEETEKTICAIRGFADFKR